MRIGWWLSCTLLMTGCLASRPDHFYALAAASSPPLQARSEFQTQVSLRVSLPVMVDRSEMVLTGPNGVIILEHDRWAAPLADQFSSLLGQDIEARNPAAIVTTRAIAEPDGPTTHISVEVVALTLQKSQGASVEIRWRLQRGTDVRQGRETFASPAPDASNQSLVQSLDNCIGAIADRLVGQLPQ